MDILEKIVAHKRLEVEIRKKHTGVPELQKSNSFARNTFSLKEFLKDDQRTGIIAEYKRKSPSKGVINDWSQVQEVTKAYAMSASGISVLTDEAFFGGYSEDLQNARFNQVPLLRKDFMIDEYQIIEAKSIGADVILLIAACLTVSEVRQFAATAKRLGLEVLLEIHNEEELEHICEDVDCVGVNNRNLKTFSVDIETSFNLINKIPTDKLAITESGISDVATIVTLHQAGFMGFLIGENFMKEYEPAIAFADFVRKLKTKLE